MNIIALEEHYTLPEISSRIPKEKAAARGWPQAHQDAPMVQKANKLLPDLGEGRIAAMDEAGITMQVLSVAGPGAELLEEGEAVRFARDYNDALAEAIGRYPTRFAGFAHLPAAQPKAAAAELDRAVNKLGFSGAMINGMINDRFLDDASFAPLLEKAVELQVPLYLHPAFPPPAVQDAYYKGLPPEVSAVLASAAFGWHIEVGIHVLRLVASGTLDRYPDLQLIIGHMGETLPFMMQRSETVLKGVRPDARPLSEVLRSQVSITTSGFFSMPPLQTALDTFGIDRILFSVDYPFSENGLGKKFLDSLQLDAAAVAQIAGGNAARLLRLDKG